MKNLNAVLFKSPEKSFRMAEFPLLPPVTEDAILRMRRSGICGTDVHILKGEYPVVRGLTIGHEPVGIIEKLGSAVWVSVKASA